MQFLFGFIVGVVASAITVFILIRIFKNKMERGYAEFQNEMMDTALEKMFSVSDKVRISNVSNSTIDIKTK
jgi:hypothetical protein